MYPPYLETDRNADVLESYEADAAKQQLEKKPGQNIAGLCIYGVVYRCIRQLKVQSTASYSRHTDWKSWEGDRVPGDTLGGDGAAANGHWDARDRYCTR